MRFTEYLIEKRKYPNKNPKTAIPAFTARNC